MPTEFNAQERVAATSDKFLRRFIDLWIVFAVVLWIFQFLTMPAIQYPSLIALGAAIPARFALHAGRTQLARLIFIVPLCIAVLVIPLLTNGVRTPVVANMPMLVLLTGWMLGRRAMAFLAALFVVGVSLLWLVEAQGWFVVRVALRSPDVWSMVWVGILTLTGIMVWSLIGNYEANFSQEMDLQRQLAAALERAEAANRAQLVELTERKLAEDALRESTQLLDSIVENMPAMVFLKRADNLRFEMINRAGELLLGHSRAQLLGKNEHDFFPGAQADAAMAEDRALLESNRIMEIPQQPITTSSGETRYLHTRKIALRNAAGAASHLLGIALDITDRKLADEMLAAANTRIAESERFIRAVADNLPGLMSYWDAGLRCRFANKQYVEWFNTVPQEMIGMHIHDVLAENTLRTIEPYLQRALRGEQQNFERTLTKASGDIRSAWTNYIPDFDANGNVVGIFVLVSDVTELKLAEEAQRIAATAFESHEAMMITDANTVILQVNRAFTETTGYSAREIVGQTPRALKSDRQDAAFYAAMWESIDRTGSWKGEIWDRRKNGEIFPCWVTITRVMDGNGKVTHFVGTQSDITLRKAAEQRIYELAFFDPLTNLPNRRMMLDRLEHGLAQAKRHQRSLAVMFLDIDRFKTINDTFGHDVGDALLKEIAKRLTSCVRAVDTVSRSGGDEFIIVLQEISKPADATLVAEKIVQLVRAPIQLDNVLLEISTSIGIAIYSIDGSDDATELMKKADLAMYAVKNAGRDGYQLYK